MRSLLTRVIAVALAFPLAAQSAVVNRKLSGPMVSGAIGRIGEVWLSPSGERVLHEVLLRTEVSGGGEVARLEVSSSDGSSGSTVLTPFLDDIGSLRWAPDETRAVFVSRTSDGVELYSVLVDGSAPLLLLGQDLTLSSFDDEIQLTDDGSRVVHLRESGELYSVPVDGSAPPRRLSYRFDGVVSFRVRGSTVVYLSAGDLYAVPADRSSAPIILISSSVVEFAIDSSGTRAVFLVHSLSPDLYSVPLDGSAAPVLLSLDVPAGSWVESFRVSPVGNAVAFTTSGGVNPSQLFLVPGDGSSAAVLVADGPPGSDGVGESYQFSPDGRHVVFELDTDGSSPAESLWSARVSDGTVALLDPSGVSSFQVSPDSARVVFDPWGQRDLYSAPIDGSSPAVRISPAFDSFVSVHEYAVTPDSLRVLYRADAETDGLVELFLVSIERSGAPAVRLNQPLMPGESVDLFRMAPDASFVLYRFHAEFGGIDELVRSPGHAVINGPLATAAIGDATHFDARNGRVAYRADQDVDEQFELYGAPSDGSVPPVRLSGTMVSGGDVGLTYWYSAPDFELSADGSTVVYRADAEVDGRLELYCAPSDGSAAPVKLNGPLAPGRVVHVFRVSPDGARVVYIAQEAARPGTRMYSVPVRGGVSVPLGPVSADTRFEFTPDSTRVVGVAMDRLFSISIDGNGEPIDLSGPVTFVGRFAVAPDSARVVYTATSAGASRLFSVSVLGGTRMNLSGLSGGHVGAFALGMDGERVVYLATVANDQLLFSVPTDGSAGSLVLNRPLVAGGDVFRFQVTPDGETVVYVADQMVNDSLWLHRVPVDGSAGDRLIWNQEVDQGFEIAPDGEHVVVRFSGLQSVPIFGGSVVEISPAGGPFAFTADGRSVVHFRPGSGRLMLTAITGASSVPLSPVIAGDFPMSLLYWPEFAVDGERVVYRAAQDQADAFEVYSSWFDVSLAPHGPPVETHQVTR